MILFIKLLRESYLFALQAIIVNKLRTLLSLLGITIGIFAVIAVFTIVDSMENTIRKSIESLGNNVLFVQKWPWSFSEDYPWWKYFNRPVAKYNELEEIVKRSNGTEAAVFMISMSKTVKYQNRGIENVEILAVSQDYNKVWSFDLEEGRYFTAGESVTGKNVCIIGSKLAENLFDNLSSVDRNLRIFGRNVKVIGAFKKEGESTFGDSKDNQVLLPVNYVRNIVDINYNGFDPMIVVKARNGVSNDELRDELTGIMRSVRSLKPGAEDNFSINETDILTKGFESLFNIVSIAGWIIGGFSLLVGGFGIANIMFVSVRERTHIIGIQKSLGAKNYFILFQFLFEAVILCLIGGALGLLLVYTGTLIVSGAFEMDLKLTFGNVFLGIAVSAFIGLISGYIPAYIASKSDPVVAIRTSGS